MKIDSMNIFIYTRKVEQEQQEALGQLLEKLIRRGCSLMVQEKFLNYLPMSFEWRAQLTIVEEISIIQQIDLVLSVGGDGTILEVSRLINAYRVPILGINSGRLGFLSQLSFTEFEKAIEEIVNQDFEIEHRAGIAVIPNEEDETPLPIALNEVALLGHPHNTMISVHVYVNDIFLATYWADGIMLATPTGSTAYSLSCGGPIVSPDTGSFIITPIAPHNLNVRPLIIPNSSKVTFIPESREGKFMMVIDGESHFVGSETKIQLKKADVELRLVRLRNEHFFKSIRTKLGWGFDKRN
jgi:NAD+ kinase